jgi:4-hydroxy-4-methyl-2-oxoglutarate aldolase
MNPVTTEQINSLAEWDTAALSNALDSLQLRAHNAGHSDGTLMRLIGRSPMVGTAVTARMVARHPGEDGIPVSRLHALIDDGDGRVIVVVEDCDDPPGAGAFLGEVNGSLLAALRIAGVVTNGRVRDIAELGQFEYPVYAQGLCVARSYMRLIEVGTVVSVAGMTIHPGDILHGDEHGVLQIPPAAFPEIVEKAEIIREDEQNIVGWSRSDEFTVEGLLALKRVRH